MHNDTEPSGLTPEQQIRVECLHAASRLLAREAAKWDLETTTEVTLDLADALVHWTTTGERP